MSVNVLYNGYSPHLPRGAEEKPPRHRAAEPQSLLSGKAQKPLPLSRIVIGNGFGVNTCTLPDEDPFRVGVKENVRLVPEGKILPGI